MVRAFICVEFPDSVIKEVARLQELIGTTRFVGKYVELENTHLTLKFLGEVDEKKVEEVKKLLSEIKFGAMQLHLGKAGMFVYNGSPRVLWLGVHGPGLFELHKKVNEKLSGLFKMDEEFESHITLARIKYVRDKPGFKKFIDNLGVGKIEFSVSSFVLKSSELRKMGPVYTDLEKYVCD